MTNQTDNKDLLITEVLNSPVEKSGSKGQGLASSGLESLAVALSYDGLSVPEVSAVGRKAVASAMKETARRYGVPIREDAELARRLAVVGENVSIPSQLYLEVAELMLDVEARKS